MSSYFGGVENNFSFAFDDRHMIASAVDDTGYAATLTYTPAGRIHSAAVALPATARRGRARDVTYRYAADDPEQVDRLERNVGSGDFVRISYDEIGNVIDRNVEGRAYSYVYDGDNRLRIAEHPDGTTETYYYLDGARVLAVERTRGGTVTTRRWFGETELRYDATGAQRHSVVNAGLCGELVGRVENASSLEATVLSAQGHIMVSADAAGDIRGGHSFGPFGEVLAAEGDLGDRTMGFNGKHFDDVSGWSYYGFRYYDLDTLQWNRIDPLVRFAPELALDDPRQQNLYTFTANNPLTRVDPDGRYGMCINPDCMAAVVIGSFFQTMAWGYGGAIKSIAIGIAETPARVADAAVDTGRAIGRFAENPSWNAAGDVVVAGAKLAWEAAPLVGAAKVGFGVARGVARGAARAAARAAETRAAYAGELVGPRGAVAAELADAELVETAAAAGVIATPYGPAVQARSAEALAARESVADGATLWRTGTIGRSAGPEAQFWALEHPHSPGFAGRYGIPPENVASANFIESATIRPDTPFVTRVAPPVGPNPGGGIEVVVPEGGVIMQSFSVQ